MKHVSILIPRGHSSLVNIEGSHQILTEVNGLLTSLGRDPVFSVQLVGLSKETKQTSGLFTVNPDILVQDVVKTDIIIIPALHGDPKLAYEKNIEFVPWIIDQYNSGAEIVSFCIGSFFLANTGLLKGRHCTTHWRFVNEFRSMFPDVLLVDDKIMTEENGIYTSGGAYSYLNLLLYLIEKHAGRDAAILTSKAFMIDIDRNSQSPFIMFKGQKEHDDEPVKKAQDFIEKNYHDRITVDKLSSMFALSRRSFERRFKKATSNTVTEYIQRVKIEAAKMSLESSHENVNEVMYKVGYTDTKAFRTTFKRITGLSPVQYRNKYKREYVV
ncbi:MAG: helix-turn-helix domain-containing protein [Ignavibacteriaceae bacterium]